jgi:uncharacterized membrane protein YbhN (UPF0104 family)
MAEPTRKQNRRRLALRIAGSAVVLSALLWFLPLGELTAAFGRVPAFAWAVAVPGWLALHLIGVSKWRMLVNAAHGGLQTRDAVRCYYMGLFGSTFLPSLVGGDAVRAVLALKLAPGRSGVVFGSVLDRMIDVVGLAAVAGTGALFVPGALDPQNRKVFLVLAGVMAAGATVGLGLLFLLPAGRLPSKIQQILVKLRQSFEGLRRQPATVVAAFLMALVLQISLAGLNWWLGRLCGIDISFQAWLFAWPMAKIAALAPVSQAGIGVREAALAAVLAPFGVPAVLAVAASLAFQGVILSGGLIGGIVGFLIGRVGPPDAPSLAGPGLPRSPQPRA